jgi:hypothetical protein
LAQDSINGGCHNQMQISRLCEGVSHLLGEREADRRGMSNALLGRGSYQKKG